MATFDVATGKVLLTFDRCQKYLPGCNVAAGKGAFPDATVASGEECIFLLQCRKRNRYSSPLN